MEAEHIAQASRVAEREREGKKDWAKLTLSVEISQTCRPAAAASSAPLGHTTGTCAASGPTPRAPHRAPGSGGRARHHGCRAGPVQQRFLHAFL